MKKRFLALALGTLAFGVALGGVKMGLGHQDAMMVKAAGENQVAYKTLSFPDDDKANNGVAGYDQSWTAKIKDDSYNITNFNNNKWKNSWKYIKCGSSKTDSIASIETANPIDKPIGKIVLNIGGKLTLANVKSIKMVVSNGAEEVESISLTKPVIGANEFLVAEPKANLKYKLVVDCTKSGKNGVVQVDSLEFYEESAPVEESKLSSIQLLAGTAFEKDQFKGNTFNTAGLSVKAHYENSSIDPTDISLARVKWVLKEDLAGAPIDFVNTDNVILDAVAAKEYFLCAQYEAFTSSEAVKLTIKDKVLVSAIEIALDATSIQSGRSATAKIVSTVPEDATDKTVNWHVVDGNVASIDSTGKVTGLKAGKTQIYATAKDKGAVESNKVEITVTEYVARTYRHISTEQTDYSGTYLLGYHKEGTTTAVTWTGESKGTPNTVDYDNGVATGTESAENHLIDLDRIYDDKKNLQGYSVRIVGGVNDGQYVTPANKDVEFDTKPYTFAIEMLMGEDAGGVEIKNSSLILRYNSSAKYFRFYGSSSTGMLPVQLYRLDYTADVAVNAKAFADKFVAAPICGTDDNTPANADEFEKFVTEYSGLSRDVRAYLANGDGKGDASFDAFYAKYNAIMEKRASNAEFYDFLAGKYRPAKTQGVLGINQNITDSTTWTLVGIGTVTIAASASLLFFRRKKSN